MKKYIKSSRHDGRILSYEDIYNYVKKMNKTAEYPLSEEELKSLAEELDDIIYREEMEYGEWYESIYDAEIEDLLDAAPDPLHTLGYRLMNLYDEEEE